MKRRLFKAIVISAVAVFGTTASLQMIEAKQLQCDPRDAGVGIKGFLYSYERSNYTPELHSYMPYDIMQAYIIADSLLRNAHRMELYEFIWTLGNDDIILNYALKYIYRLADYDPIRYFRFLLTQPPGQKRISGVWTEGDIRQRASKLSDRERTWRLLTPYYILHIKVNETVENDVAEYSVLNKTLISVFSNVKEIIKGQILPPMGTLVYYDNEIEEQSSGMVGTTKPLPDPPNNSNFLFEYSPEWHRASSIYHHMGAPLVCDDGTPWIKVNNEYIVFAELTWFCSDEKLAYYGISPVGGNLSYGMYPIIDGNVIDEGNSFGWGEKVPVDEFKENLRKLINEIKNYGE